MAQDDATDPTETDLGPKPEAQVEPGEPAPGGVDAVVGGDGVDGEDAGPHPVPADLDPADNPAVEDVLPDEMRQGEDTSTQATEGEGTDGEDDTADQADRENPA